jgi:hypothetical protein
MSQENVEVAARFYEPATSKSDLLRRMPRTMALAIQTSSGLLARME